MSESDLVLVTGASGFIATHVVQQLLKAGHKVRGSVRSLKNEEKVQPIKELCPDAKHPIELVEADLNDAESWKAAVKDCVYVIHLASPFLVSQPKDENELIKPAVEGSLNILRACQEAKTVKRVVLTSSIAAVSCGFNIGGDHVFTEKDWTDVKNKHCDPYLKSKTLAEKAAWDFIKDLKEDEKFELVVINPSYALGPVLCGPLTASMILPKRMLEKSMPMLPRMNFAICDVRDIAAAHIAALTAEDAVGHRHIINAQSIWINEIAQIMEDEFKSQGYNVPRKNAPYAMMWLYGLFDKEVKAILPGIGKVTKYDTTRLESVLGIKPRPIKETVIDMCYSMIERGKVKKTSGYKGPNHKSEGGNQATEGGNQATKGGNQATVDGNQATEGGNQATEGGNQATEGGKQATEGGNQATEGEKQATEDGNQATEGGNQATEGGNQATEGGNQATEGGNQATEGGNQATEGGNQATEGENQATEGGNQATEGGNQATEGGNQATEGGNHATEAEKPSAEGEKQSTEAEKETTEGANQTTEGADQAVDGADQASEGANQASEGADQASEGENQSSGETKQSTEDKN